jgi:hypothetical protein
MANVIYENSNDLCKNNYYYALASSYNPSQLPSSDTGIADSGSNGFYFSPDALVNNLDPKAPTVGVQVENGISEKSVASATLASAPSLPEEAMLGHVMPSFPHTLIGLGPFADLGYTIVFTKTDVKVIHPDGHCILKGWREGNGPRLWRFPLKASRPRQLPPASPPPPRPAAPSLPPQSRPLTTSPVAQIHPSQGFQAIDAAGQACLVTFMYGAAQAVALAAQAARPPFDPRSLDLPSIGALVGFYHACIGFPVKQSWLDTVRVGNFDSFDSLTFSNVARSHPCQAVHPSLVGLPR